MTKQELIEEINLLFGAVEDNKKSFSELGEYFHNTLADDILHVLEEEQMEIKIRKIRKNAQIPKHVGGNQKSCWMDLYASEITVKSEDGKLQTIDTKHKVYGEEVLVPNRIEYHKGDVVIVKFGVAIELPNGYEGYIVPRSSTFKNFGLILTNSYGVIDEAYKGDNDEWMGMFLATKDGSMCVGDRPAQFRIHEKMPPIHFTEVDTLNNEDRGGYGTSGK